MNKEIPKNLISIKEYSDHFNAVYTKPFVNPLTSLLDSVTQGILSTVVDAATGKPTGLVTAVSNAIANSSKNMDESDFSSFYAKPFFKIVSCGNNTYNINGFFATSPIDIYFQNNYNFQQPFTASFDGNGYIVVYDIVGNIVFSTLVHNTSYIGFLELLSTGKNSIQSLDYFQFDLPDQFDSTGIKLYNNYKYETVVSRDLQYQLRVTSYGGIIVVKTNKDSSLPEAIVNTILPGVQEEGQYYLLLDTTGVLRLFSNTSNTPYWSSSNAPNSGVGPYRLFLDNFCVKVVDSGEIVMFNSNTLNVLSNISYSEINFTTTDLVQQCIFNNASYYNTNSSVTMLVNTEQDCQLVYANMQGLKLLSFDDESGNTLVMFQANNTLTVNFDATSGRFQIVSDGEVLLDSYGTDQTKMYGFAPYTLKLADSTFVIEDKLRNTVWSSNVLNEHNYYNFICEGLSFTDGGNDITNIHAITSVNSKCYCKYNADTISVYNVSNNKKIATYPLFCDNITILNNQLQLSKYGNVFSTFNNVAVVRLSDDGVLYGLSPNGNVTWSSVSYRNVIYDTTTLNMYNVFYSNNKNYVLSVGENKVSFINVLTDSVIWSVSDATSNLYVKLNSNIFNITRYSDNVVIYNKSAPVLSLIAQVNDNGTFVIKDSANSIINTVQ